MIQPGTQEKGTSESSGKPSIRFRELNPKLDTRTDGRSAPSPEKAAEKSPAAAGGGGH